MRDIAMIENKKISICGKEIPITDLILISTIICLAFIGVY